MLYSRGLAYLKSGDYQKSIADYDAALNLNPKNAYSLHGRGIAKQKKDDAAGAEADLAAARRTEPTSARRFNLLA